VDTEKALYRLILWTEGKFEFIPVPVTVAKKIRTAVSNLLMEGMRQADEFKKNENLYPGAGSILRAAPEAASAAEGQAPVVHDVIQLAANYPRVEDLVEHCSQPDFIVYEAIAALTAKKVLVVEVGAAAERGSETDTILPMDAMITLRERIVSRFSNIFNLNYGKILLISSSGAPAAALIKGCSAVPGYSSKGKSSLFQFSMESPLGTAGSIEICGGMDVLLFSIPEAGHMGPLWRAFGSNAVGLVILWDEEGTAELESLEAAKQDILSRTEVPVAYVYAGAGEFDMTEARKAFSLTEDEKPFAMGPDGEGAMDIFSSIFKRLINEDKEPGEAKTPGEAR